MTITSPHLVKFLKPMQYVYGNFSELSASAMSRWSPRPSPDGHRGRYLWTDAFGVCNFLTLYKRTQDQNYLILAERLITNVHDILGYTRDGKSRLPGATDDKPLGGGLRIGKIEESGSDGDGQYYHYLTMWMFALNRMAVVSGKNQFNDLAVQLVKAVHPRFVQAREAARPRMVWKMSTDLQKVLVPREGSLDSVQGYVVYRLIQNASSDPENTLVEEIDDLRRVFHGKYDHYRSLDALDLGMAVWTAHWFTQGKTKEKWAVNIRDRALQCLDALFTEDFFDSALNPPRHRLAFREFGAAMGLRCLDPETQTSEDEKKIYEMWDFRASIITADWEKQGILDRMSSDSMGHTAITSVMFSSALDPGGEY
ncbi:hypothetical protein M422DRAFT_172091 [Sphaerobolus stellatus SS14]|uniref:Uncharacterized protein n=1 Tax=Sphaerobolus stellatus (strain SS14) TaxID=990650 RepID=A0A0C9V3H2_SPHS4|nr:hypothetical protein M422DRAFT_172091 [Sphaerobolus stellatus SS14]